MLEADYVVGCDGGHSTVREQIGIARGGTDFDQLMVLAVFRSRELHEGFKRFPPRSTYPGDASRPQGLLEVLRPRRRRRGLLLPRAGAAGHHARQFRFPRPDAARRRLQVRLRVRPCRLLGPARRGRRDTIRSAASSSPATPRTAIRPMAAIGLNNGLDDVANLGWKLAARLKGWGGDALLASYSEERRPVFKETAEDFIDARIAADRRVARPLQPGARPRRVRARLEGRRSATSADRAQMTYEPHYEGSPVVFGPPGGVSSAHGSHTFKARAGHHLPPQLLSSGRNVFEELGRGVHAAGVRCRRRRGRGVRAGGAGAGRAVEGRARQRAGGRTPTRRG